MRVGRIFSLTVVTAVLAVSLPAAAGGSWMRTPDPWVEPGEEVELVAYIGASNADGQWIAYLNLAHIDEFGKGGFQPLSLGPVTTELTGLSGYLSHRVYLRFTVPADLAPGTYQVSVRRDLGLREEQSDFLGDLIGAHVAVGLPGPDSRYEWPLSEPLVEQLPDDALLSGPGWEITAGEARRGVPPTSTTPTSTSLSSQCVTTTAVTTDVTTVVTTDAVLVQLPTRVVSVQVPEDVDHSGSPWLPIAAIAITTAVWWSVPGWLMAALATAPSTQTQWWIVSPQPCLFLDEVDCLHSRLPSW